MKSEYRVQAHLSNNTPAKCLNSLPYGLLFQRLMRAAMRSFEVFSWFLLSFAALGVSGATAAEKKSELRHPIMSKRAGEVLKSALPFKFDGYTIGSPAERNNFPGVYSGISDPETVKFRDFYSISCSPVEGGDIKVYRKWNKGPVSEDTWPVGIGYSLSVIYFIDDDKKQYIYGMISNTRALTNGVPVIVERQGWSCALSNS